MGSVRSVGFVDRLDRAQRKRSFLGFPIATIFKFVDDQGPYLAAIITYYGLLAIFPLLLLAVTILGWILQSYRAVAPKKLVKDLDAAA